MLAKVFSIALVGLDAHLVEVEVDIGGGLPQFSIVGLPDAIVRESRDRVRSALKNSGFQFPVKKVTVNLAPAGLKKEGSGLDLAIGMGILAAEGIIPAERLQNHVVVGELSLDGRVKSIPGALSIGLACRKKHPLILPAENGAEAALIEGVEAFRLLAGFHPLADDGPIDPCVLGDLLDRCLESTPHDFHADHLILAQLQAIEPLGGAQ